MVVVVFLDRFLMAPSKRNPRKSTCSQPSTSSPIPTPSTPPHLRRNLSSYDETIHPDLSCYNLFADTHFNLVLLYILICLAITFYLLWLPSNSELPHFGVFLQLC